MLNDGKYKFITHSVCSGAIVALFREADVKSSGTKRGKKTMPHRKSKCF